MRHRPSFWGALWDASALARPDSLPINGIMRHWQCRQCGRWRARGTEREREHSAVENEGKDREGRKLPIYAVLSLSLSISLSLSLSSSSNRLVRPSVPPGLPRSDPKSDMTCARSQQIRRSRSSGTRSPPPARTETAVEAEGGGRARSRHSLFAGLTRFQCGYFQILNSSTNGCAASVASCH